MTSIIDFEENIKSNERPSDVLLDMIESYSKSKESGVQQSDSLAKIVISEGRLFANLIRMGKRDEKDSEDYETLLPGQNIFSHENNGLDIARDYSKQANAAALYDRENRFNYQNRLQR